MFRVAYSVGRSRITFQDNGADLGQTDAFPASEFPRSRAYDHVVALTRSGTTTEVVRLLMALRNEQRSTVITTTTALPAARREHSGAAR